MRSLTNTNVPKWMPQNFTERGIYVISVWCLKKNIDHLCLMEFPNVINWASPFPILGLLVGIFHSFQIEISMLNLSRP